MNRRTWIKDTLAAAIAMTAAPAVAARRSEAEWVVTTQEKPWQRLALTAGSNGGDVFVRLDRPLQTIEGFGACFNELGWTALQALSPADRNGILRELFTPGGAGFTLCRMPLGANDFSRDWYSYDETPGDFALAHFSIENDRETLIPFIHAARQYQPGLKLWASPWSPPVWMKTNKHYAAALPPPHIETGLRPDQVGKEGTDMFIQEEAYFRTYAAYFGRFIDAYRQEGIPIAMVMPQNEFNSAQIFPSCTWTPEGLARFIRHLGPEMARRDVEIFFGTMERPNEKLVETSLLDPVAGPYIRGVGFQWAGKGAVARIHERYPVLSIYQTEQECGDGRNDWRFCRYAWTLMKHYLTNGATAYMYWNMALKQGGVSRWGWAQNSLVTVDTQTGTYTYNPEYYLLKHVSHFVQPGAVRLETASWSGYENLLAFRNPDGRIAVVLQNDLCEPMPIRVRVGEQVFAPELPPDSFSTIVVDPE